MVARSVLARRLRHASLYPPTRRLASSAAQLKAKPSPKPQPVQPPEPQAKPPTPQRSWLTQKIRETPAARNFLLGLASMLGYNSPKQLAGRRAFAMYEQLCVPRADEERAFWQNDCALPPTFQSWFSVTNLHVWLLTVRLRALPDPIGKQSIQALVDHFFIDVEDRVRQVLQPATPPKSGPVDVPRHSTYTSTPTDFYKIANEDTRPRGKAPERLVTRQMKILKEQLTGLSTSLDLGLVRGDADLAAAVWRNFLGARGARGIVYPSSPEAKGTYFRRSINLVGGEVEKVAEIDKKGLEAEEARDDGSGVHDFAPNEAGRYVQYPELMADIVRYVRKELVRLEKVPDEKIIGKGAEGLELLKFGRIRG